MDIITWLLEVIESCFVRNDEKWNVGRIVLEITGVVAIAVLGYLLYR